MEALHFFCTFFFSFFFFKGIVSMGLDYCLWCLLFLEQQITLQIGLDIFTTRALKMFTIILHEYDDTSKYETPTRMHITTENMVCKLPSRKQIKPTKLLTCAVCRGKVKMN